MGLKTKIQDKANDIALQTSGLNLPKALLIIPDGNGRWAKKLGLSISDGHKQGGKTFSQILDHFMRVGIDVLGVWGFSEDNWKRPQDEVNKIMEVIGDVITQNLEKLIKNNIKFITIGRTDRIEKEYPALFATITNAVAKTSQNSDKTLALFLDYGERFALEKFAKARINDTNTSTYALVSKTNSGLPLFDMVLRTSGEQRLSGFGPLVSLAEFVSVKKNLPELEDIDLLNALREFSKRQRRFGGR